jgi:hypothetical protein
LVAEVSGVDGKISATTHGSLILNGISLRLAKSHRCSNLMYVALSHIFLAAVSHSASKPTKLNFNISHELDEFMVVDKPLTQGRRRKKDRDIEKLDKQERDMEEQCVTFNSFLHPMV